LHILEEIGADYLHKEFLANPKDFDGVSIDPRKN